MPSERLVRAALRSHLDRRWPGPVALVEEFWVPISHERADLAVIGSALHGFEIKTARDTLRRLERQCAAYGRIFDYCTAVVADKHLAGAEAVLPSWWGVEVIVEAEPITLESIRPARDNPSIDTETLVRLLWRDEAFAALEALGKLPDGRASRVRLWERLLELVPEAGLRTLVREALIGRDPGKARIATRRFRHALEAA